MIPDFIVKVNDFNVEKIISDAQGFHLWVSRTPGQRNSCGIKQNSFYYARMVWILFSTRAGADVLNYFTPREGFPGRSDIRIALKIKGLKPFVI